MILISEQIASSIFTMPVGLAVCVLMLGGCSLTQFEKRMIEDTYKAGKFLDVSMHPRLSMNLDAELTDFPEARTALDKYVANGPIKDFEITWSKTKLYRDMYYRISTRPKGVLIYGFIGHRVLHCYYPK